MRIPLTHHNLTSPCFELLVIDSNAANVLPYWPSYNPAQWNRTCHKAYPTSSTCTRRSSNEKPEEPGKGKFRKTSDDSHTSGEDSKFQSLRKNLRFSNETEEKALEPEKVVKEKERLMSDNRIVIDKITDKAVF